MTCVCTNLWHGDHSCRWRRWPRSRSLHARSCTSWLASSRRSRLLRWHCRSGQGQVSCRRFKARNCCRGAWRIKTYQAHEPEPLLPQQVEGMAEVGADIPKLFDVESVVDFERCNAAYIVVKSVDTREKEEHCPTKMKQDQGCLNNGQVAWLLVAHVHLALPQAC